MDLDFEGMYKELQTVIPDDTQYQAVVGIIEKERSQAKNASRELQAQGIARAREAKVSFGRPRSPKPKNYDKIMSVYLDGSLTIAQAANLLGVSRSLFYSWACREREKAKENKLFE